MTDESVPPRKGRPKAKRPTHYSRNLGANERPTFYATPELINEIEAQREADSDSKSALIAKLLVACLQSQGGRELRTIARANRRTLVSELENYLAAPLDLTFYQELLEAAARDNRDRTQILLHLIRLGWEVYQTRQGHPTERDNA